jgi:enoyl-CoA hydratase/carnithine racemase
MLSRKGSGVPDYETLIYAESDHVATLTLNRPEKKNAISWRMFEELRDAFEHVAASRDVRCLVVTGAGGAFCSGADLTDEAAAPSSPLELKDRMRTVNAVAQAVFTCPKPTIAKVTGVAAGAGCNLALGCDLIVASTSASFAELFVKRGLVVDFGGSWVLTRLLPLHKAKELALLGGTISAGQADSWGMLNRYCSDEDVDAVVEELARSLAAVPPRTVSLIKANLARAAERSLEETLEAEAVAQAISFGTEDTMEALSAWIQKREPRFTGR